MKRISQKRVFLLLSKMCYGGQERFVSRLSDILKNEYDISVVLFDSKEQAYSIYGEIIDLSIPEINGGKVKNLVRLVCASLKLRRIKNKLNPICCISFGLEADLVNILSGTKVTKSMVSIRGFFTAEKICGNKYLSLLYKYSDLIICVSKQIKEKLQSSLNVYDEKIVVIYNAFDVDEIEKGSKEVVIDRRKNSIVAVGTLKWEKGYWHLVKAVAYARTSISDISLTILGNDYDNNRDKLEKLINKLGIDDAVCLRGWCENPYPYVAASELFVLSSVREGFPNALVEAMACSVPVIASDCMSGPREILGKAISEEENEIYTKCEYGILVSLKEDENYKVELEECDIKLGETIVSVLRNEDIRNYYSRKSYERASHFTYDMCKERYMELINNGGRL